VTSPVKTAYQTALCNAATSAVAVRPLGLVMLDIVAPAEADCYLESEAQVRQGGDYSERLILNAVSMFSIVL
jgi:hypothetical protein